MILREYDIEEISYQPGKYRVVEKLGEASSVLAAGLDWLAAQNLCGTLERARQRFIEDNGLVG